MESYLKIDHSIMNLIAGKAGRTAWLVMCAMTGFMQFRTNTVRIANKKLCAALGMSDKTIRRAISALVSIGALTPFRTLGSETTYFVSTKTSHLTEKHVKPDKPEYKPTYTEDLVIPDKPKTFLTEVSTNEPRSFLTGDSGKKRPGTPVISVQQTAVKSTRENDLQDPSLRDTTAGEISRGARSPTPAVVSLTVNHQHHHHDRVGGGGAGFKSYFTTGLREFPHLFDADMAGKDGMGRICRDYDSVSIPDTPEEIIAIWRQYCRDYFDTPIEPGILADPKFLNREVAAAEKLVGMCSNLTAYDLKLIIRRFLDSTDPWVDSKGGKCLYTLGYRLMQHRDKVMSDRALSKREFLAHSAPAVESTSTADLEGMTPEQVQSMAVMKAMPREEFILAMAQKTLNRG